MRVRLRQDGAPHTRAACGVPPSHVTVALDDDSPGCGCTGGGDGVPVGEVFTIRARGRDHFDADGNPHFTWTLLGSGAGIERTVRTETDDTTGHTTITGQITMAWSGQPPDETAVVDGPGGLRWHITAVAALPGALRLTVGRVSDAG